MPMIRQVALRQASAAEKPAVPWAPHLEECALVTQHRQESEKLSEEGEYPPWVCAQGPTLCNSPKPPWVCDGYALESQRLQRWHRSVYQPPLLAEPA